jgi:hypothetical protein
VEVVEVVAEIPFCETTVIDVNGKPPVNAGGVTDTCIVDVLDAVVNVIDGASGSVAVTMVAVPAGPDPAKLVAKPLTV